jgi:AcrR family transcriptional regulator
MSKNNKERIFDAAFILISEKGYANVSMRDIANHANVALSQVNYHYENKDGLFKEVLKSVKEEYLSNLEDRFKNLGSKKDKLSFFISYLKDLIKVNTNVYRLILDFYSLSLWSEPFKIELKDFLIDISTVLEKYIDGEIIINSYNNRSYFWRSDAIHFNP